LAMTGGANIIQVSWANVGAPIIDNILAIRAAFAQVSGYPLTDVFINSTTWSKIINNTQVRNTAGSSQEPFLSYREEPEIGANGQPTRKYVAILRGVPDIRWHMNDDILSMGGNQIDVIGTYSTATAQKLIPDNMAIFTTENTNGEIAKMYQGGEPVVENPGMPMVTRSGFYFWHEFTTQPSAIDLISLGNFIPELYIPGAVAPATCIF
jgi:hypothetical protein